MDTERKEDQTGGGEMLYKKTRWRSARPKNLENENLKRPHDVGKKAPTRSRGKGAKTR